MRALKKATLMLGQIMTKILSDLAVMISKKHSLLIRCQEKWTQKGWIVSFCPFGGAIGDWKYRQSTRRISVVPIGGTSSSNGLHLWKNMIEKRQTYRKNNSQMSWVVKKKCFFASKKPNFRSWLRAEGGSRPKHVRCDPCLREIEN